MTPNLPLDRVFGSVSSMLASGAALHWLKPSHKAPANRDWSNAPKETLESLRASHRENANIGIRLGEPSGTPSGYIYLIDLDVRDESQADAAREELARMWPEFDDFPYVVSGSGGSSRHFYFTCDQLFRSRKLAKSTTFAMVWDEEKQRDVKKNDWEIELFGTGKQAVIPPSIHPDTGKPYIWGRKIDFDMMDLGIGPVVPADLVTSWGASADAAEFEEDDDDLFTIVKKAPLDLDQAEITDIIENLPEGWLDDREKWVTVGAALHHQYEGDNKGFTLWCDWSEKSEKYDERDQERVWKSFKENRNPIRMPTLIQAAGQNRLATMHAGPEDEDTLLAELLGDVAETHPLPKVKIDENWTSYLQITEDGNVKSTLPNIQLIVANDVRTAAIIAKNEFSQETVLINSPGKFKLKKASPKPVRQLEGKIWKVRDKVNGDTWSDQHDYPLRTFIEAPQRQGGYAIKVSDRDLNAAVEMAAAQNAFHPVTSYLEQLVWDGVPRVDTMFLDYLGCDDDKYGYHRATARLTMLGAVTRVFEPGHKFDFVPILEGSQGKGKSTFIRTLGHSWTVELSGDFHNTKEMVETMQGAWILEIPELQGFSKADTTILKAFISKISDKVRLSYDRRARVFPRQCIFIGSTNDGEYLRDTTGGRRFWPIACKIAGQVDNRKLARNINQLWAEATYLYKEMRAEHSGPLPLYISDKGALAQAEALQDSRRVASVEEGYAGEIQEWLDRRLGAEFDDIEDAEPQYRKETCIKEVWCEMWRRDASQLDQRQSQMIGRALRMIDGWEMAEGSVRTKKYGPQRVFRKIDELEMEGES